jgi:quercetin dioxygenase-like cupin family protein
LYAVFVNGKLCEDPKLAKVDDFYFGGLNIAGNTENIFGANFTPMAVDRILGLNTLGISVAHVDYASNGQTPPHTHPRATKVIVVLEVTLYVGFITSNPDNRLFTKVLNKGDVFVNPIGLIHFAFNAGVTPRTQSMSSTRDNGRTPIKLCLTSVSGLTNELQY